MGGGFGGVVAAESLAKQVGEKPQLTLISRSHKFIFYPDMRMFAMILSVLTQINYERHQPAV